jgi:hypothetical protein
MAAVKIGNRFLKCDTTCVLCGKDSVGGGHFKSAQNKLLDNIMIMEGNVKPKA